MELEKATSGRPTRRGGPEIGLRDLGEACGMWALEGDMGRERRVTGGTPKEETGSPEAQR